MPKYPDHVNKYNHTPRRVFEKAIERLERKVERIKLDIREIERAVRKHDQGQQHLQVEKDEHEQTTAYDLEQMPDG